ncbi:MAG TPA: hypothetical protein VK427_11045, partial [Kofleriaceae bacterium]|nr:hypothetical protein [Kofleriaceae bacterium]
QFARVERGEGTVEVTALDDTHVDIEVTASEPVLVALGTGYYPRWRATHATGADLPVYALPSIPSGKLHVPAAWVAPGKTTFTVDAPLPSDGKGRLFTFLAALVCVAILITWCTRLHLRLLRRVARVRWPLHLVVQVAVPLAIVALFAKGCADSAGPLRAFELGSGSRPSAVVQARTTDSDWQDCSYSAVTAIFTCDGLVQAYDGMAGLLNDARPSWGFNTPGIVAYAMRDDVELRARITGELSGTYWMAASGATTLTVDGEPPRAAERAIIVYGGGRRTIEMRAAIPQEHWSFTFVREDTIIPARPFLDPPPDAPPASIRAIR